jgi:hypothetical protein
MEIRAQPLLPRRQMGKVGQSSWQPEYLCFTWSRPHKPGLKKGAPAVDWSSAEDGAEVGKKTYEHHYPVRINKIPSGGYMYGHWYGRVGQTNKWQYGVADLRSFKMKNIKGVLKHPLMVVENMSAKDRRMWQRDGAPPLGLSPEDYETWMALQAKATGNQRNFAT